ncbi:transposase IS891/IS1136/IS1341 family [Stanieria cyanosphaera PCC 7437]|uniref:Transposase IS891/IS1136/IS1341 family n=1 Tax=Stanieria cyanosphaera (strain ATCC 29371 / PCC 7437) TaxID=111780 RepID=K9XS78_STAC7|nr:RNA-guided endonuclease TnpB family protein [Stanieria cyanosphaera]AFZ35388.1 transposase IS891/IS1136/IS1341 family [Stanieria cyanosphaera PCC 7437]
MLNFTYEYKLIPTKSQIAEIERTLGICKSVWNYALAERKDWVNFRKCLVNACSLEKEYIIPADTKFPNYHVQAKALTKARANNSELKSVNAQLLQQVLRTLDRAWEDIRKRNFGFPRFKNAVRMRSFIFPQFKSNPVKGNKIKLPQLGWVKFRKSREIPEGFQVKQARVVRRATGYYLMLSIQLDVNVVNPIPHGHALGIDIGLDKYLATSDGELINRPKFFNSLHRKLKLLQRRLRNKQKRSNNRFRLNRRIAKIHEKIAATRKDFHFKLAHKLCEQAGMIFVEDIDFKSWAKGMLRKHTLDASFGQFFQILQYVAWKTDTYFLEVDKNYTSQICPNCETKGGKKLLSERTHNCPACGYTTNRDVAAAQVIRNKGLVAVGQPVNQNACGDVSSGG